MKRSRINEDQFDLSEENWLTNRKGKDYSPTEYGQPVIKGPPKETDRYSTEELSEMNFIGVYEI